MIVVDTNVIAYLFIEGPHTDDARRVLLADPEWSAPVLWKSELQNVLALYLRKGELEVPDAAAIVDQAQELLGQRQYSIDAMSVLELSMNSGCSAYDCEFVALARKLSIPLVTCDKKLLRAFPGIAHSITSYAAEA